MFRLFDRQTASSIPTHYGPRLLLKWKRLICNSIFWLNNPVVSDGIPHKIHRELANSGNNKLVTPRRYSTWPVEIFQWNPYTNTFAPELTESGWHKTHCSHPVQLPKSFTIFVKYFNDFLIMQPAISSLTSLHLLMADLCCSVKICAWFVYCVWLFTYIIDNIISSFGSSFRPFQVSSLTWIQLPPKTKYSISYGKDLLKTCKHYPMSVS